MSWNSRVITSRRARLSVAVFSVLLVGLIVGFLVIGFSASDTIQRANQLVLRSIVTASDIRLRATVASFQQLVDGSDSVAEFFKSRENDPFVNYEAHQALIALADAEDLIHSMYLVRLRDGIVLHDEYLFSLEHFSDRDFVMDVLDQRVAAPQWEQQRLLGPLYKTGGPRWTVPVALGYPSFFAREGVAVLNLDLNAFSGFLVANLPDGAQSLTVEDSTGSTVATVGESQATARRFVYQAESALTGWEYRAEFETTGLLRLVSGAMTVWAVYAVVMSVWAVAGIWVFTTLVRKQERVVFQVKNMIRDHVSSDSIWNEKTSDPTVSEPVADNVSEDQTLERLVRSLLQKVSTARSLESEQMRLRRRMFVESMMLRQEPPSPEFVLGHAEDAGIDPDVARIVPVFVMIGEFSTQAGLGSQQRLIQGAVEQLLNAGLSDPSHVPLGYWTESRTLALVVLDYSGETDVAEWVRVRLLRLQAEIERRFKTTYIAAVGRAIASWSDVPAASREARRILDYRHLIGPGTVSTPQSLAEFHVDVHEEQLSDASELATRFLRSEDDWLVLAQDWLDGIMAKIPVHSERIALVRHALYLIYEGLLELSAVYRELYYDTVIRGFWSLVSSANNERLIRGTIELLSDYQEQMIRLDKKERKSDLGRNIVEAVQAHLTDADLSLKGLAAEFGTSISTVSRLFQEITGTGFAQYLSRERMVQAKQHLSHSDNDIADICTEVGYTNYAAFARAFKREVGVSPAQFRARASGK